MINSETQQKMKQNHQKDTDGQSVQMGSIDILSPLNEIHKKSNIIHGNQKSAQSQSLKLQQLHQNKQLVNIATTYPIKYFNPKLNSQSVNWGQKLPFKQFRSQSVQQKENYCQNQMLKNENHKQFVALGIKFKQDPKQQINDIITANFREQEISRTRILSLSNQLQLKLAGKQFIPQMVKPEQHLLSKYNDYPSSLENNQYEPKVNSFINIKFQVNPKKSTNNLYNEQIHKSQAYTSQVTNRASLNCFNQRQLINSAEMNFRPIYQFNKQSPNSNLQLQSARIDYNSLNNNGNNYGSNSMSRDSPKFVPLENPEDIDKCDQQKMFVRRIDQPDIIDIKYSTLQQQEQFQRSPLQKIKKTIERNLKLKEIEDQKKICVQIKNITLRKKIKPNQSCNSKKNLLQQQQLQQRFHKQQMNKDDQIKGWDNASQSSITKADQEQEN